MGSLMSNFIKSCFVAVFILVLSGIPGKTLALDLTSAIHIYTPIELKPISYSQGVKLANVCSVTDVECREKAMMFDIADEDFITQCQDEGYTKTADTCPTGQIPDPGTQCPYLSTLYKKCLCDTSVYTHTGTDTSVCGSYNVTVNTCSDDRGHHFSCECNSGTLCNGATQYVLPALKNDSSIYCLADNGEKKYANEACLSCDYPTVLKADKTGCECPSAFSECTYGPEIGSEQCSINGETFYSNCKTCPNLGTYTACPTGYTCELETCSGKYYTTGCQSGYNYTCSGTGYSGGYGSSCDGRYKYCNCSSGYTWYWSGCFITCDSSFAYTCDGTGESGGAGEYCMGKYNACSCNSGYEWTD